MDLLGGNPESENPESDSQSVEGEEGGKTPPNPKAEGALAGTFAMASQVLSRSRRRLADEQLWSERPAMCERWLDRLNFGVLPNARLWAWGSKFGGA